MGVCCLGQTNCRVRLLEAAPRLRLTAVSEPGILAVLGARKSSTIAASGERNNLGGLLCGWAIISHHSRCSMYLARFLDAIPVQCRAGTVWAG